ncbi:MAG: class I SAM-dependent methyltransferase [Myxococcales bacterium]|nr:class I SAM-dependent methyltransferase [Myxococcales bacterium]
MAGLVGCRSSVSDSSGAPSAPPAVTSQTSAPVDEVREGTYLGRTLAPTMTHEGAPWLVRPEREAEESTAEMLRALELRPGQVACDIGAGNGYHSLMFAKAVGEEGQVVAVDIQPEMLDLLRARAEEAGAKNVVPVLGEATDPKLGEARCDLIFLADVYHELSDPPAMLGHFRRALRPGGRIALLEFRAEDPEVPIKPLHKMTKAQIDRELEANGFTRLGSYDALPWQHLMFFGVR